MAIAVLPRATAAAVITRAVARGTWAVAFTMLVLDVPGLLDVFVRRGLHDQLATPLAATALRPVPWLVLLVSPGRRVCVTVYELGILSADPSLATEATYLLNRPAVAIVLVELRGQENGATAVASGWTSRWRKAGAPCTWRPTTSPSRRRSRAFHEARVAS